MMLLLVISSQFASMLIGARGFTEPAASTKVGADRERLSAAYSVPPAVEKPPEHSHFRPSPGPHWGKCLISRSAAMAEMTVCLQYQGLALENAGRRRSRVVSNIDDVAISPRGTYIAAVVGIRVFIYNSKLEEVDTKELAEDAEVNINEHGEIINRIDLSDTGQITVVRWTRPARVAALLGPLIPIHKAPGLAVKDSAATITTLITDPVPSIAGLRSTPEQLSR